MIKIAACSLCKHLLTKRGEVPKCKAFPNGIPDVITTGDEFHLEPFEGDGGIQYERLDESRDFRRIFNL
ncbi:hypothetical protein [Bacillus horti]|uniref:Uncharacterized protein n=1 Tax=Caldalkalibacillus horti TaxID=77523 RepID=A0ABT9W068_9BACI|nr:hypothetical protein [Bacillus horti]MDQ0166617.1 hypothetical protein [Bacillus horti]